MYNFPEDFNGSVLVGHTLELVCFSANQVIFHFNDDISICAETSFAYEKPLKDLNIVSVPTIQSDLMQLLEHRIVRSFVEKGRILNLLFDNEHLLRFEALPEFESYRLTLGKDTIII
jgi:hypothetical protein